MPVGPLGDDPQRDAAGVAGGGALQPLLAPVDWRAASLLPAGRGLGDAAVHRGLAEVEAGHPVVGVQGESVQRFGNPLPGPLFEASADGAFRASGRGDPLVAGTMDQREHDVLEDGSVGDPAAVRAQRVADDELLPGGEDRGELVPQGFEQARRQRGHGRPS